MPRFDQGTEEGGIAPSSMMSGSDTQIDSGFASDVQTALWEEGIDVTRLPPNQYTQLVRALWDDPFLQDLFNQGGQDYQDASGAIISSLAPYIKRELFDPTQSH